MRAAGFELVVILLLVAANGLFAMSEMAIIASRRSLLKRRADEGDARARTALDLAEHPNRFLPTVQIGITLVGVLAGVYGGATLASHLSAYIGSFRSVALYAEELGLGIVVLGITFLSLIIGELVPKRIALANAERLAAAVAPTMARLSRVTSPVIRLLESSTAAVLQCLRIKDRGTAPATADEIKILIEQGTREGTFEEAEQEMIESILRLGNMPAVSLMTPRLKIEWLNSNDTPKEVKRQVGASTFSCFPVSGGRLDNVLGVALARDLLAADCNTFDLRRVLRKPLYVPENKPILRLLELFRQAGTHMALVVDEYGHVEGLVTLTDVMEEIVGDLASAGGKEDPSAVRRPDGSWLVDGRMRVEEFKELLGFRELPGAGSYHTLAGFVLFHMRRIPAVADSFERDGWRFEVVDMDGRRVDKVLVARAHGKPRNGKAAAHFDRRAA